MILPGPAVLARMVPLACLATLVALAVSTQAANAQEAAFSTYLGGSGLEGGQVLTTDSQGNLYVGGYTSSHDFPVSVSSRPYRGGGLLGSDAFVAKFSPEGGLVYATLLGGLGDEAVTALAVDAQGRAVAAGVTTSRDFPVRASIHPYLGGAVQQTDVFVVRLSADGSTVEAGTFLGGKGDEMIGGIDVDDNGRVYVSGTTTSYDLPTTMGAIQRRHAGGVATETDAFVARLSFTDTATNLEYLTYLGGSIDEVGISVAADADGNTVVAGFTNSPDFPPANALQPSFAGPRRMLQGDLFLAQIDSSGEQLDFSTFLGGGGDDQVSHLALSADGRVFLTGWTSSSDFPVTPDALQSTRRGSRDAFLAVLTRTVGAPWSLDYATYFGGSADDRAYRVAVDADGQMLIAGRTASTDLLVSQPIQVQAGGGAFDGFVARLSPDGQSIDFATYFGGSDVDAIGGLAATSVSRLCVTGATGSADFLLVNPTQTLFDGGGTTGRIDQSAFVSCFAPGDFSTGAEDIMTLPERFTLHANYPNPFNPTTTIGFEVPVTSPVSLEVFDLLGRHVATVANATYAPGTYHITIDIGRWASGTYFYRLHAGGVVTTRKMVLVK